MRITKSLLRELRSKLIESQSKICAAASTGGLAEEHNRRFPHYIGGLPDNQFELMRQLLHDDLCRIIHENLFS